MTRLLDHQYEGALAIRSFKGRALLADDMGLGKTLQVLYYLIRSRSFPAVVVTPASLKLTWEDEASKHFGMSCNVLSGRKPPRANAFSKHTATGLWVVNYEVLPYWFDFLSALQPRAVVVEEGHYIKNRHSQRYKAVKKLAKGVDRVIAVTGTPLLNNPSELWATLSVIAPKLFPSFIKYAFQFCKPRRTPWGWQYTGAKNLPELHRILRESCMIRRNKALLNLPPKLRRVVPLEIEDRWEYTQAKNDFLHWLRKTMPGRVKKAKRSAALVKIGYLLRLTAKLKRHGVTDWIDNFLASTDEKLVVFSMHTQMVNMLHRRYRDNSVVVQGGVSMADRKIAVDQFQHQKDVRIFIGNIRAAGVGITLTAATHCAFTDLPWTPGELAQGEDRIHRIGQKNTTFIHYLIARKTIEEDLCARLQEKQAVLEQVLNGANITDNLDIFNEILRNLK